MFPQFQWLYGIVQSQIQGIALANFDLPNSNSDFPQLHYITKWYPQTLAISSWICSLAAYSRSLRKSRPKVVRVISVWSSSHQISDDLLDAHIAYISFVSCVSCLLLFLRPTSLCSYFHPVGGLTRPKDICHLKSSLLYGLTKKTTRSSLVICAHYISIISPSISIVKSSQIPMFLVGHHHLAMGQHLQTR
jgi:hypothetical protein